jgi:uncharacterized membrane protein YbhN (UPF0104 family)
MKKYLPFMKVGLSIFLLYWVSRNINTRESLHLLLSAQWPFIISAFLTCLASNLFGTLSWYWSLKSVLKLIHLPTVISAYWIGLFFNMVLPSNVGGDIFKGYHIVQHHRERGFLIASIVFDRLLNLSWLGIIGIISVSFVFLDHLYAFGVGLGVAITITLFCFSSRPLVLFSLKFRKYSTHNILIRILISCLFIFRRLVWRDRKYFLIVNVCAFFSQFNKIYFYIYLADALGINLKKIYLFFINPVIGFVSALPISLGGLGIREYTARFLATRLAIDTTSFTTLISAGYIIILAAGSFGIIFFLASRKKQSKLFKE